MVRARRAKLFFGQRYPLVVAQEAQVGEAAEEIGERDQVVAYLPIRSTQAGWTIWNSRWVASRTCTQVVTDHPQGEARSGLRDGHDVVQVDQAPSVAVILPAVRMRMRMWM